MKVQNVVFCIAAMISTAYADVEMPLGPETIIVPGKGSMVVVNYSAGPSNQIQSVADSFSRSTYVPVAIKTGEGKFCCKTAATALKKTGANAAVFVIDEEGMPIEILAMEDRWAAVNLAALRSDGADADKVATRLRRLVTRSLGSLLGLLSPRAQNGVMAGAASLADIDNIKTEIITFDLLANVKRFSEKSGLVPGRRMNYRKACERGVAPTPANDIQKKIWDEFHSMPTKPIKIKYDKSIGK